MRVQALCGADGDFVEVGPAYAVWTGTGAAGAAIAGMLWLGESVSVIKLMSVGLVLAGVTGLNLSGLNLSGVTPRGSPSAVNPAGSLHDSADRKRRPGSQEEPSPWSVLKRLAAETADEERVQDPDDGGRPGPCHEPPARVTGKAAGEGNGRTPARDKTADDDELRPVPLE